MSEPQTTSAAFSTSPEGNNAREELIEKFEGLLDNAAELEARLKESSEKSDSDFRQAYKKLVPPPRPFWKLSALEFLGWVLIAVGGILIGTGLRPYMSDESIAVAQSTEAGKKTKSGGSSADVFHLGIGVLLVLVGKVVEKSNLPR